MSRRRTKAQPYDALTLSPSVTSKAPLHTHMGHAANANAGTNGAGYARRRRATNNSNYANNDAAFLERLAPPPAHVPIVKAASRKRSLSDAQFAPAASVTALQPLSQAACDGIENTPVALNILNDDETSGNLSDMCCEPTKNTLLYPERRHVVPESDDPSADSRTTIETTDALNQSKPTTETHPILSIDDDSRIQKELGGEKMSIEQPQDGINDKDHEMEEYSDLAEALNVQKVIQMALEEDPNRSPLDTLRLLETIKNPLVSDVLKDHGLPLITPAMESTAAYQNLKNHELKYPGSAAHLCNSLRSVNAYSPMKSCGMTYPMAGIRAAVERSDAATQPPSTHMTSSLIPATEGLSAGCSADNKYVDIEGDDEEMPYSKEEDQVPTVNSRHDSETRDENKGEDDRKNDTESPTPRSNPKTNDILHSNNNSVQYELLAVNSSREPKPCTHVTKDEHDSCPTKSCIWNDLRHTGIPASYDVSKARPFSRTGLKLLRDYLPFGANGVGADPGGFRDFLTAYCEEYETGKRKNPATELYEVEKEEWCCDNEKHVTARAGMGDFRREMIDDYVAFYTRVWAEFEDVYATDGLRSTRDVEVREEVFELYDGFRGLKDKYRILDKIGEGTFSSVYKAVDQMHTVFDCSWCRCSIPDKNPSPERLGNRWAVCGVVALKRIYVTSSTERILNELAMLRKLSCKPNVAGLISALRSKDQIIAVLPFYEFHDFREFMTDSPSMEDIAHYMKALMIGLRGIHEEDILHRDIKPTNFLYNKKLKTGVIVDFGLAQVMATQPASEEHPPISNSSRVGYYENDKRPSIRGASRAGTRGFRAPEVLLRVIHQTTAIDIWAAGVILLCTLTKTYPFFNSPDDLDALLEITWIYGTSNMKKIAAVHGRRIHFSLPDYPRTQTPFETIVEKLNARILKVGTVNTEKQVADCFSFLKGCMCLSVKERLSAVSALEHPFLKALQ
ncbi:hypothetical protein HDU99_003648 [Rhizoclosmatium hyalinum]|nr:hypothetical protein HDU99_003648 [Rhizoclosmatium hyalinum]